MALPLHRHATAACEQGVMCMDDHAGHALSLVRLRLATATPSGWRDARVLDVRADGRITVADWRTEAIMVLWQHADLTADLSPGEIVAVHAVYGVLAAGDHRYSVKVS